MLFRSDKTGKIPFFPTIHEDGKTSDPGSSSCFKMTEKTLKAYSQADIEVPAIRLDEWLKIKKIESIDLICMDTQGATLKILQGMGEFLKKAKYIVTECEKNRLYEEERSEEHTSELQSHSFISYAVFCLKKKKNNKTFLIL